ncbi:hypothetical protein JCM16814_30930 [Desulfobaculum senezii]|jgi:hypothetical protein|uniref:hypothetical protein n=1 Tax=Desulfobaculum sp. SPO524 TaxID=3378071 RepID=UPI003855506D
MLTIRCSRCKTKLWKYNKLGKGEVLRCHKARIDKMLDAEVDGDRIRCPCGQIVGHDKGSFYKMVKKGFVYSGKKVNKL